MRNLCVVATLLLLLITSAHGQMITGPERPTSGVRLYLEKDPVGPIDNFTVLAAGNFTNTNGDILWCQSANNRTPIGEWYFPNGGIISTGSPNAGDSFPLYIEYDKGQVGLLRDSSISGLEGLFRCVIPNENEVNQTLWVAIYRTSRYATENVKVDRNGKTEFNLVSTSRDADPPVFTLSFNVTDRPPTVVSCTVNNSPFDIVDEDLNREVIVAEDPVQVLVTVTVRMRQSGTYQYSVSTGIPVPSQVEISSLAVNVTVTGIPTNLVVMRTGLYQAVLSWSAPAGNDPVVQGYEVFYDSPDGTRQSKDVGFTTMLTVENVDPELSYSAFVVAYGGNLPSEASNISNISEAISLDVRSQSTVVFETDSRITCTLNFNVGLSSLQLAWFSDNLTNSTQLDDGSGGGGLFIEGGASQSLDLTLDSVNVSTAGVYSCGAIVTDSLGDEFNISRDHTLFLQLPGPTININLGFGTNVNRTFISGQGVIFCNAEVLPIGVPRNVSFSWYGPDGQISEGDKYELIRPFQDPADNNLYISQLIINNLESSDNLTVYYCTVEVGINDTSPDRRLLDYVIPGRTRSVNISLKFEALPVPVVTVTPSDAPIIGESFSIDCSATFDRTIATVSLQWLINGSSSYQDGVSVSSNSDSTLTLTVTSVNVSDEGIYTCVAILDIAGLEVPENTTANTTYTFSTLNDPVVDITASGSNIAGSTYTLTCTVSVITGTPNITWIDPDGNEVDDMDLTLNVLGLESTLTLEFTSLDYSHVGLYTCSANLSISSLNFLGTASDSQTVEVQIPTPDVTVTADNTDTFIRGTERFITCNITLNPPSPTNPNVTLAWIKDGAPFDNSTDRVIEGSLQVNSNTYSSTIRFSPLNTTDGGDYQCTGTVRPEVMDENILISTNTGSLLLTVEDIPDSNLTFTANGTGTLNEPYSLMCRVSHPEDLVGFSMNLTIEKMTSSGYEVLEHSTGTSVEVSLSPLTTSDAGMYRCSLDFRHGIIDHQRTFEDFLNIIVTIPSPVVNITTDAVNPGELIEGTYIDLVCLASVDEGVDTDVVVTIGWLKDDSNITNGSDFIISEVTVGSGNYISTVRIAELKTGVSNGVYRCSVSVVPSVATYVTGSSGSDEIVITVREFDESDVMINISFSSTPTAGDQLNVTCSGTVPERLVHTPDSFIISYDLGGQEIVAEDNPDATQSEVIRVNNVFMRTVMINPVKTSDAKAYYCEVVFGVPLIVDPNYFRNLEVYIPPPSMSVSLTPSGTIYESTSLVITCNATLPSVVDTAVSATVTWTGPNSMVISSNGRITVGQASEVGDNVFQSKLIFNPVDNGDMNGEESNDNGKYTCEMSSTDNTDNNLILNGVNSTTEEVTVEDLPELEVNISTSGSTEVGQKLNITCIVTLVEGLVENITIYWNKTDDIEYLDLLQVRTSDGPVTNLTLVLDPVQFDYRGVYMCMAMFNISLTHDADSMSEQYQLVVDFPPFDVTISQSYYDPLYTGTSLTITCDITLSSLVDIPVVVSNEWTRSGSQITEDTITEDLVETTNLSYTASLEFFPLNTVTDNGEYRCFVSVIPEVADEFKYITNITNNASTALTVLDLPVPTVTVSRSSSDPELGDAFEFNCNVSVVDRLIVSPEITWSKVAGSPNNPLPEDDISVDSVRTNNELSLTFTTLNSSDAGRYTCDAVLTVSEINITRSSYDTEDLILQIPTPEVTVTRSQTNDTLLAGSQLTIFCHIIIDTNVDTPFTVDTVWTRTDSEDTVETINSIYGRVRVCGPYFLLWFYLKFSTLSSLEDSGLYRCEVVVDSNSNYTFVYDSEDDNDTTTIDVINPEIGNFAVYPNYFLGLETTCSDSLPYDSFTLNCSASKPALVVPELEVFWLHNGTLRSNNSVVYTAGNGVFKLNVLSFPTSVPEDSGTYQCIARLIIPDSDNISRSDESNVIIRAARPPFTPTYVSVSVSQTSAYITFTIPAIAYTPEQYRIEYIGLELQNTLTNSVVVDGVDNITDTNLVYSITLTGLEEDNSYNFSVVSTNCRDSTRTPITTFTTYPAAPTGPVRNCRNTTFNPRNVTLSWDPPLRALQNGEITGYTLFCQEEGSSVPVSGTNGTMNTSNTAYTIPVITPFRSYNCSLFASNEIGSGPDAFCTFRSAEDSPDDPPETFTSTATKTSAIFTWTAPGTPNGIVTGYNFTVSILSTTRDGSVNTNSSFIGANDATTSYSMNVSGLVPYQKYTATVAARTSVGYGPEAGDSGRTQPDFSSAVDLVTVLATGFTNLRTLPAVDVSTLNVTWTIPATPNGYISRYNIDVTNSKNRPFLSSFSISSVKGREIYTWLLPNLVRGVPYTITIGAVNEVGQGDNVSVVAFSSTSTPGVSPENIEHTRSEDGTSITVTWDRLTLEDVGGFFEYSITVSSGGRKRQNDPSPVTVNYTQTSASVGGLEPSTSYTVTVMAVVIGADGERAEGPTGAPIVVLPNPEHAPTSETNNLPVIAGAVAAGVIFLIIVVVLVALVVIVRYFRRSRTGKAILHNDLFELSPTNGGTVLRALDEPPEHDDGVTNGVSSGTSFVPLENQKDAEDDEEDPKKKLMEEDQAHMEAEKTLERMKPIAKASFHEHVLELHNDADKGYENEYKSVPMSTESAIDCSKEENNKLKNRFANIFPYDYTRVKLSKLEGVPDSDYINASYVDGYIRKDCYACAQGPLPATVSDFWRMIWEKRLTNIVMLTGVVEGGKKKCEQYWPENVGQTVDMQGGVHVTMTSKVPFSDYTIHSLKVTKPEDKDVSPLDITHYHFTAWPDHGVPQFATSLIGFINRVQKGHDKEKGVPMVVHCSAGVGRTGTFVTLDSMMDRLRVEDSINVYEFLREMRSKRMFMVQTLAQYVFIHDALDEYITCGETHISAMNLKVRVSKMHKQVPGKNISGFQEQYQLLEQVCYVPHESTYSDAKKPVNLQKNRYPDIVPLNLNRPRLRPDGSDGSDYINASFVDGYKLRNAYLVTQGPLKNTVEDIWRMAVEFKCKNIVMLCNTVEEGEEKCYMYWPTKEREPVEYGNHKVTLQSEISSGDYIIRKFLVQNDKSSNKAERDGVVITQFHYTVWPEHSHPTGTGQIIEMIDMLTRSQMNTGNKPITIVCNDGVGRSGAFLCIHSQLEKIKTEGEIDVFKFLKSARTKRIGLVSEMDHYVFIHQVLADYVESFDPYANFKN